jgi:hypothetical protein
VGTKRKPINAFLRFFCVGCHNDNTAWNHIVALLYAQLTRAIGLNDVCDALRLHLGPLSALRGATPPRAGELEAVDELGKQETRKESAKHAKHAKRQGNFTFASFRVFSGQSFQVNGELLSAHKGLAR